MPAPRLQDRLIDLFQWRSDPDLDHGYADDSGWFRDSEVLSSLGPGLANLLPKGSEQATVVMGTESRGTLLAALVATALGVGVAEVRKTPARGSHDDVWLTQLTPPDYQDRHLELAMRRSAVRVGDRVLFVDDWIDTGAQAQACRHLVEVAGGHWLGAHVIVDALTDSTLRRTLTVRSLLNHHLLQTVW